MRIALAADHTGFEDLAQIKALLGQLGHTCVDYGPTELDPADDYPDFVFKAAQAVASGECQRGIIIGGSGQGEAMAANRVKGVRCAVLYGLNRPIKPIDAEGDVSDNLYEIVVLSRQHNDSNMLSLAARFLNLGEMERAIDVWLDTEFSNAEHHSRRNQKLDQL